MKQRTKWTAEMVAIAAGMKRAGFSAARIGERLGVSALAVKNKMESIKAKRTLLGKGGNRGKLMRGPIMRDILDVSEGDIDEEI